jgi:hypothetical protein
MSYTLLTNSIYIGHTTDAHYQCNIQCNIQIIIDGVIHTNRKDTMYLRPLSDFLIRQLDVGYITVHILWHLDPMSISVLPPSG